MIKAVIIEDSRLARLELKELLKPHRGISIAGEADNADAALELIRLIDPDLIFLDIHLPGKNGFEILQELDKVPAIIFTTAFDEYALKSFDYQTIDYLLKPIVPEKLERAINKAQAQLIHNTTSAQSDKSKIPDRIFVKDGNKAWFVNLDDILLLESRGNYTQIYFKEHSPLILKSLGQMEASLDERKFLRVNRQQIIGLKHIADVSGRFGSGLKIIIKNGQQISVSRRQAGRIKELSGF